MTRAAALKQQLATNPHSPDTVRAFAPLRNVDAWYDAFDVKPGDKNYVKPEERGLSHGRARRAMIERTCEQSYSSQYSVRVLNPPRRRFRVNALDLAGVRRALNSTADLTSGLDFNRDGRVNALDLAAARQNLNRSLPAPSALTGAVSSNRQAVDYPPDGNLLSLRIQDRRRANLFAVVRVGISADAANILTYRLS